MTKVAIKNTYRVWADHQLYVILSKRNVHGNKFINSKNIPYQSKKTKHV